RSRPGRRPAVGRRGPRRKSPETSLSSSVPSTLVEFSDYQAFLRAPQGQAAKTSTFSPDAPFSVSLFEPVPDLASGPFCFFSRPVLGPPCQRLAARAFRAPRRDGAFACF